MIEPKFTANIPVPSPFPLTGDQAQHKLCYSPSASSALTWINRPPVAIAGKKTRRVAGFSFLF